MAKKNIKKTVAEIVTERFVKALEREAVPWVKPWDSWSAWSGITGKDYTGMNALLLENGEYVTEKAAKDRGIQINEDARKKYDIIIHYSQYQKRVSADEYDAMKQKNQSYWSYMEKVGAVKFVGDEVVINKRSLRFFKVWNVETQTDGDIKFTHAHEPHKWDALEKAEQVVSEYTDRENVKMYHGGNEAYNADRINTVRVPEREQFENPAEYYCTVFHELIHSTADAVGRDKSQYHKDKKARAREELVAEIGAAYIMSYLGIENDAQIGNAEAYCQSWAKALKDDSNAILYAAPKAIEAAEFIINGAAA